MSDIIASKLLNPFFINKEPVILQGEALKGRDDYGRTVSKPLAMYGQQAVGFSGMHQIVTMNNMNPTPSNAFTTNGVDIQFRVQHEIVRRVQGMSFIFQITETNSASMYLAPVAEWIDHIEIWGMNPQVMLYRIYGDALFFKTCSYLNSDDFGMIRNSNNISAEYSTGYEQIHPASAVRNYRLDFLASLFDLLHVDLASLRDDLIIHIFTKGV